MSAGKKILQACLDVGGTLTGEHGIGMEKIHQMPELFSEPDLDAMLKIRDVFSMDRRFNRARYSRDRSPPTTPTPSAPPPSTWELSRGRHTSHRSANSKYGRACAWPHDYRADARLSLLRVLPDPCAERRSRTRRGC